VQIGLGVGMAAYPPQ